MSIRTAQGNDPQKSAESNARIFEDPSIQLGAQDDPVAKFIVANYKTVLATLIAVALGFLAYNSFRSAAEAKRAAATELFAKVRETYASIVQKQEELTRAKASVTGDDKAKAEAQQKVDALSKEVTDLRQKAKLMIDSLDSPKPFDLFGRLYGGLIAARFGDFEAVKSALTSIPWETVGRPGSPERLVAEMATFGLAKALTDSPADRPLAREKLVSLAKNGEFASVQAVLALSSSSESPEQKSEVRDIITSVRKKFPIQEKYLKQAEDDLGS